MMPARTERYVRAGKNGMMEDCAIGTPSEE